MSYVQYILTDVPGPIPAPAMATVSGRGVISLSWSKPNYAGGAPILAYKVESWVLGEGAFWSEVFEIAKVLIQKIERNYLSWQDFNA